MKLDFFQCTDFYMLHSKSAKKNRMDCWRKERCLSQRKVLRGRWSKLTVYNNRPREGPWMSMTSSLPFFHFQVTLSPGFSGCHPKKTKAIISIQFAPSPCMNTDRLSYFGHAPRGVLWEAGGQINGYYHSHRLITGHLDPGAPTPKLHAEGIYAAPAPTPGTQQHWPCDWQLTPSHFFILK